MIKEKTHGANMALFTTFWGKHKTFKLMPIDKDCPYMEVIYDPSVEMLVVLSKTMKENYEMLPRLTDDGEYIAAKKPRMNGRKIQEERRLMKVPQEFYMVERDEQEAFIKTFAVNANTFDYKKYLDLKIAEESTILKSEEAMNKGLLGADGKPMTIVK